MIQFNQSYSINGGQDSIVFSTGNENTISGKYNSGTLSGIIEGNTLKATFHNEETNGAGLIEIEFNENGFDAKWKQGLELGPMRGKWIGLLPSSEQMASKPINQSTEEFIKFIKSDFILNSAYKEKLESTTDFVEDFSMEFDGFFFENLNDELNVVVFNVDNSEASIEECYGRDTYSIYYDFKNNCVYMQDPRNDDQYQCFLDTKHASIPYQWYENEKFLGCYRMSDLNNKWTVSFHGDFESVSGEINDTTLNKIKSSINSATFYAFLDTILYNID